MILRWIIIQCKLNIQHLLHEQFTQVTQPSLYTIPSNPQDPQILSDCDFVPSGMYDFNTLAIALENDCNPLCLSF